MECAKSYNDDNEKENFWNWMLLTGFKKKIILEMSTILPPNALDFLKKLLNVSYVSKYQKLVMTLENKN